MAKLVEESPDFPRSLGILETCRVGDPNLSAGPVIRYYNEVTASGKMTGAHQRNQNMASGQFG